jgi:5'-nucleotidase
MSSSRRFHRSGPLAAALVVAAALALSPVSTSSASAKPGKPPAPKTVDVRLISVNDFHGNLEPPTGSSGRVTLSDGTTVDAGGAAYLATHVLNARAAVTNSFVVAAGDLIGASPLTSALFHDEPSIKFFNYIGLTASSAGNHEFDEGYKELLRIQLGGCHPVDGCQFEPTYRGSSFPFLGANVTFKKNGLPALLPFTIKVSGGIPIGIIGVPLEGTPDIVSPEGIKDLAFGDEVTAINRTAKILDRLGVKSQIVLLHQGDNVLAGAGPNDCKVAPGGLGTQIATQVSPMVDAVFSGHSHQGYNCVVTDPAGNPRPLTQGSSFGRLMTVVDLKIDTKTRDVVRSATVANNEVVTRNVAPDPGAQAIVDAAKVKAAAVGNRQVGTIVADIVRTAGPSGESPMGDLIADAQLAISPDAVVALMNPGGVRGDLTYGSSPAGEGDGVVTYAEAFTVQPFGNVMQTVSFSGAQLDAILEQQWILQANGTELVRILQPSSSLHYDRSLSAPIGSRVSNITINGVPVDPAASYRVTANNFLIGGGDGFSTFTVGTGLVGGPDDLEALIAYLTSHPHVAPPATNRITVVP